MPVSLQGFVKQRRHIFGRQTDFNTKVTGKRAYPFKGVPEADVNWVDPDVDVGSLDLVVAPHREAPNLTAPLTDPQLRYNTLPLLHSGFFGGAVVGAGSPAVTRLYEPASTTVDSLDPFTYSFGDDVLSGWEQFGDGILTSVEITGPEGLGALTTSMSWLFGSYAGPGYTDYPDSPSVPDAINVVPNETIVYLKDMAIYIASDPYDVTYSGARVADALHTLTMRWTREIDQKRFANGDQSFDADAFATASRTLELECSWAETSDIVGLGSESDAWNSTQAVDRYVRLVAESTEEADTGVPYSWDLTVPMRYYTRTHGEVGGNAIIVLTGKANYAPGVAPVYSAEVVNTLADANF